MTNTIEFPISFSVGDKVRTSDVRGIVKKVTKAAIFIEVTEVDHFQIKVGDEKKFTWLKRGSRWSMKGTQGDRDFSLRMDDGGAFGRLPFVLKGM